jgi:hypothetical protein
MSMKERQLRRGKLTIPSLSLLIPWSKILSRVLSKAPAKSPSGGPSRTNLSKLSPSAVGLFTNIGLRDPAPVLVGVIFEASLLLLTRVCWVGCCRFGIEDLCSVCLCCWEMREDGELFACPSECADCNLRSARCVRGEGGLLMSCDGGASRVGEEF